MFSGCGKCRGITSWLVFLLGVAFLLVSFGVWNFWGIQWYAALFLIIGFSGIAQGFCKDCQAIFKK